MNKRRVINRPAPRIVSPHSMVGQDAASSAESAHANASEAYSKLTPVYAPTPRVAAERIRARNRGMDWVRKEVVTKKVVTETQTTAETQGPSIADLMAAELAAHSHTPGQVTQVYSAPETPASVTVTTVTETIETTETFEEPQDILVRSATTQSLLGDRRDVLLRQFQQAAQNEARRAHRNNSRKIVVEKVKHHAKKAKSPRSILAVFLFGVILAGIYATIDSFSINQQARQALAQQASDAQNKVVEDSAPVVTSTEESTDEGDQVPGDASTEPTTRTAATHSVAPDLAKMIKIPKLGINAPVISVGLTSNGAIDTPKNIWEAAWYNGSAKPGQDGATFIDGHSSANGGALFGHLDRLTNGDTIQIVRGDGAVITYKVAKTAIVDKDAVDMRAMLKPYGGASKGLNLITCEGDWIASERTLTKRVLIWAVQV